MPRHINPTRPDRTAIAPYNFVPLPNEVFVVEDGIEIEGEKIKPWERHDEFVRGTYNGWIDLTIRTLTPLFIRGPVRPDRHGAWDERESRLRPESFQTPEGLPVIPGSSLRGMTRNLVEILSFAKIQPVSKQKPFFRDLRRGKIGDAYRKHFIEELGEINSGIDISKSSPVESPAQGYQSRVKGGIIAKDSQGRYVIRPRGIARIERRLIAEKPENNLHTGTGPMALPNWDLQYKTIFVKVDDTPKDYFFEIKRNREGKLRHPDLYLRFRRVSDISWQPKVGYRKGILVLTGNTPNKHLEFVFLEEPDSGDGEIVIPEKVWDRFHDEDQITLWQERAFPKDKPAKNSRQANGYLGDGEPVFYLIDESLKNEDNPDGLFFLGRAQMFRLPYDKSPEELIPENVRNAGLDLAEALFGRVDTGNKAVKGRVFFEDAIAVEGGPDWFEDTLVPCILSSPKVTTFQHYLTQDRTEDPSGLTTYLKVDSTTIRGHKLYWHRWDQARGLAEVRERNNHDEILASLEKGLGDDRSHTIVRPAKAGVTFKGRIRFENLTELELGALLTALELPEGCAHKLGMGKPLGLGSVQIETQLKLINRERRYSSWTDDGIEIGESRPFKEAFARRMLRHAEESGEILLKDKTGLRRIARLDALFIMLDWDKRPDLPDTRYMVIEHGDQKRFGSDNEFQNRPVLPTPNKVAGKSDPWPNDDPPQAGKISRAEGRSADRGAIGSPAITVNEASSRIRSASRLDPALPIPQSYKAVQKGQTREGFLHFKEGTWVVKFEGDPREGDIVNSAMISSDVLNDSRAEFYIVEQSKKIGIKARFIRLLSS